MVSGVRDLRSVRTVGRRILRCARTRRHPSRGGDRQEFGRRAQNLTRMSLEEHLDFHDLAVERVQLERREPELARRLQVAKQRADAFPSEFGTHEVRKLKLERQAALDRLAELSGLLLLVPIRHARDPR
jgi:hypothetical protein